MSAPRLAVQRDAVVLLGDVRDILADMPAACVDCCVTSPVCWGHGCYDLPRVVWGGDPHCRHMWGGTRPGKQDLLPGATCRLNCTVGTSATDGLTGLGGGRFCRRCGAWLGSLGSEPMPGLYVEHLVSVFRLVRRVLKPWGTLWLNLGDACFTHSVQRNRRNRDAVRGSQGVALPDLRAHTAGGHMPDSSGHARRKHKDLEGIPWRVALALEVDGWYLRSDVTWSKPNPMPETARDRPRGSHEYVFLLSASTRYFYDYATLREPRAIGLSDVRKMLNPLPGLDGKDDHRMDPLARARGGSSIGRGRSMGDPAARSRRSVWTIATQPCLAHFASFPAQLLEQCVLAGTSKRGCCPRCGAPWERAVPRILGWRPTCGCGIRGSAPAVVLDPFAGSGTTLAVAARLGRRAIGIEFNPDHKELIRRRCADVVPTLTNLEAA